MATRGQTPLHAAPRTYMFIMVRVRVRNSGLKVDWVRVSLLTPAAVLYYLNNRGRVRVSLLTRAAVLYYLPLES